LPEFPARRLERGLENISHFSLAFRPSSCAPCRLQFRIGRQMVGPSGNLTQAVKRSFRASSQPIRKVFPNMTPVVINWRPGRAYKDHSRLTDVHAPNTLPRGVKQGSPSAPRWEIASPCISSPCCACISRKIQIKENKPLRWNQLPLPQNFH